MRSVTRRFVNLIDTFYDANVGLVASAAAEPDQLYAGDDALFERTVSRLTEMRSEAYLARRSTRVAQAAPAT
jgi:cell division protein ZapE